MNDLLKIRSEEILKLFADSNFRDKLTAVQQGNLEATANKNRGKDNGTASN